MSKCEQARIVPMKKYSEKITKFRTHCPELKFQSWHWSRLQTSYLNLLLFISVSIKKMMIILSISEDAKQLELSYIASGDTLSALLENTSAVSYKVKHKLTL